MDSFPTSRPGTPDSTGSSATTTPDQPMFEVPEVTQLASMDDLDGLSADLDSIDLTLAELDQPMKPASTSA